MNFNFYKTHSPVKSILLAGVFLLAMTAEASAQTIPSVQLKDLTGSTVDTGTLENDGNPIVICFWATWCSPCKRELNNYMDYYADWQEETGVKIIAVSIDDTRSTKRVAPYFMSSGWEFEILLDPSGDFKRAMGVNNVPHTFVYNGEGELVWSHNNYAEGDEEELYEELLKLVE
ncbi:MAG: TlpA disulfide reductase family protein [Flavobacteriales bacterium]|jgi:cytochrome c biogenesis protein CcmG/thiol:disulfide interchange protein DsbE|tara:strand:- start:285 stop:806 length:522 start_codon:yes stop_codon:yes gene_type:complete